MSLLIQYFIKLSISLGVVYLFYWLVLQRLTFYNWNRCFLLGYSLLAFCIPFINISQALQNTPLSENKVVQFIPLIDNYTTLAAAVSEKNIWLSRWDWISLVFITGSLLFVVRFLIQHASFLRVRKSATLILDAPIKLYHVDEKIIPFSFGNAIFINQQQHNEDDLKDIIRHEFVHVKQKHSIDMLWGEWLCILNWYNPFAWLLRHAIRQNLEFIADNNVVQNGIDKKQYQYLLVKVVGVPQFGIATNFNFTSLKKRIAMMNKLRSAKVHLVKFLFLLPLAAVLLLAFRSHTEHLKAKGNLLPVSYLDPQDGVYEKAITDTIPLPPPPDPPSAPQPPRVAGPNSKGYIVTVADNHGECVVIIKNRQNKIVKAVDLVEWNENKKEFVQQYGELLPAPPPVSPVKLNDKSKPVAPVSPIPETSPISPVSPKPAKMPENVKSIHNIDNIVTITLKNGKTEKYDLNKADQQAAFEKKYGKMPEPPSPPAVPIDGIVPVSVNPQIRINAGEPTPIIIVDGKEIPVTRKIDNIININNIVKPEEIHSVHVLKGKSAVDVYGEKGSNGVIIIDTKLKMNGNIELKPPVNSRTYRISTEEMKQIFEEAQRQNILYIGVSNPLKFMENINPDDIEVQIQNSRVVFKDGIFYAHPTTPGVTEIKVFKKEKNGTLKLLNSRSMRVIYLPKPKVIT